MVAIRDIAVDIVIPTRNRPKLTEEAVRSVIEQSHDNWRLWIVDDASEPYRSAELVSAVTVDQRIEVLCLDSHRGPAGARQTGLYAGDAPFVATLDSDDLWLPEKLEHQLNRFLAVEQQSSDVGAVLCGHRWVKDGEPERAPKTPDPYSRSPLVSNNLSVPLLSRAALERSGGFEAKPPLRATGCEHIECYVRWSGYFAFVSVQEILVTCRTHSSKRESDQLGSLDAATDLNEVLKRYEGQLLQNRDDYARVKAAVGARFLDAGENRRGLLHLAAAVRGASARTARRLIYEYGPFVFKCLKRRRCQD